MISSVINGDLRFALRYAFTAVGDNEAVLQHLRTAEVGGYAAFSADPLFPVAVDGALGSNP